jgi:DNA-binding response OmpR family regulator
MRNLLLIDDDEELCSELGEVLEAEGFKVDIALDGLEALRKLQKRQHQIIILDLKLPGLNGYRILQSIRNETTSIKVLVLSGQPFGKQLLKKSGTLQKEEEDILKMADCVINKPFLVDNLIRKVKELSASLLQSS